MKIRLLVSVGAVAVLACSEGTGIPEGMSRARVLLTDAPFPYDQVAEVSIYVVSVAAATSGDTSSGADWVTIAEPRRRFDLLTLQGGATALVGEGLLPANQYAAVRLVIDTDSSWIKLQDRTFAIVNWQRSGEQTLHALVEQPLALFAPGVDFDVIIDFDVGRSFQLQSNSPVPGTPAFLFIPWIRAVNEGGTGQVAGTVRGADAPSEVLEPVPNASVTVFRQLRGSYGPLGGYVAATGRTDAEGRYAISYLSPGQYRVEVRPPEAFNAGVALSEIVTVNMGETTTVDISLPAAGLAGEVIYLSGPSTVVRGGSVWFYANMFGPGGDSVPGASISWASRNPAVGALEGAGNTARFDASQTLGTTWIVAASSTVADSVLLSVVESDSTAGSGGAVATVTVTPAAQMVAVGDSLGFWATLRDAQGTVVHGRTVTWTATDTSVARFEYVYGEIAILRALKPGTITVTATSEGKSGSGTVTVQ